jgi:predicted enzyme related to lactoylglutathione lyase
MNSTASDSFMSLAAVLKDEVGAIAEVTEFPSGGAMLDVRSSDGRVFVLACSPRYGYSVDEIHADEGFTTGYQHTYSDFGSAARKLREMVRRPILALGMVILETRDLEASKAFYESLGLMLHEEQHGRGPRHYAAMIGPLVFELYPCHGNDTPARARLGFETSALDRTLDTLRAGSATIIREPHDSPWGRCALVQDPDGNRIQLTERPVSAN